MFWETLRLAVQAIFRNSTRSFLTVLGVVIGVAAVIAMATIGRGSSQQVAADVAKLGTDVLILSPGQDRRGPARGANTARPFDLALVDQLVAELPSIETASPIGSGAMVAVFGNENFRTTVRGTNERYLQASDWDLALGRGFTRLEARAGKPVCILGETVRSALFGSSNPIGEKLRLKNITCEVIGLLEAKGAATIGVDQDDVVLVPFRLFARRIAGSSDVPTVYIAVRDGVPTEKAMEEIAALMRDVRRIGPEEEDDFNVMDLKQVASVLTGINTVLTGLLSAVAAVSLLVGGIGIMNIMLVSVTERTREIGIRMAVGAQAGQVLMQFLVEAVMLSLLGGAIGVALGLGLAALGAWAIAVPFAPDPMMVLLAFGFSALVGVVFGYFPARRAARLDPIHALRRE